MLLPLSEDLIVARRDFHRAAVEVLAR
jgi:hypothetical protein